MTDQPDSTPASPPGPAPVWRLPAAPNGKARPETVRETVIVLGRDDQGDPIALREPVERAGMSKAVRGLAPDLRSVARAYAGLLERAEAGRLGGAAMTGPVDGGRRSEPALAMLADRALLARVRGRVGPGRARLTREGLAVPLIALVEGVVAGGSLSSVLRRAGIAPSQSRLARAGLALARALGRVASGFPHLRA